MRNLMSSYIHIAGNMLQLPVPWNCHIFQDLSVAPDPGFCCACNMEKLVSVAHLNLYDNVTKYQQNKMSDPSGIKIPGTFL